MSEVLFVTKRLGAKVLYDEHGLIGKFKNSNNDLVQGDDGVKRRDMTKDNFWYMTLNDPAKIERAKNYKGFGVTFNITTDKPIYNTLNNLKEFGGTNIHGQDIKAEIKKELELERQKEKEELAAASKRFGILYGQLHKARKDADPVLIEELKQLSEKLGIPIKEEAVV